MPLSWISRAYALLLMGAISASAQLPAPPSQPGRRFTRANETWIGCNESQSPTICRAGKDGIAERIAFEIPDAGQIWIHDLASGTSGPIAVTGTVVSNDSRMGTFVAWIEQGHKRAKRKQSMALCAKGSDCRRNESGTSYPNKKVPCD